MKKCGFAMALVLAALPAGSVHATDTSKTQLLTGACGEDSVKFNTKRVNDAPALPPLQADEARVYMITEVDQPQGSPGCGAVVRMGVDGKWVGATCSSSYVATTVKAGEHHLCGSWQELLMQRTPMPRLYGFTAEAGKTYYFGLRAVHTNNIVMIGMDALNPDEGNLLVISLPVSVSKPKD